MKRSLAAVVFLLAACGDRDRLSIPDPGSLAPHDREAARSAALAFFPQGTVLTVCGPSVGASYTLEPASGWARDGMAAGAFVLLRLGDGEFQIVSRDAGGSYEPVGAGASVVPVLVTAERLSFVVAWPSTGVIQS